MIPVKTKKVNNRPKVPWYDEDLKQQRRLVRRRERVWLKYNEEHQWLAYKQQRNKYKQMLTCKKRSSISSKVLNARGNIKELYQITNNLTSHHSENPMPEGLSEQELADEFSDFFLDKINKIRLLFEDTDVLTIKPREDVPVFTKFAPMSESEVRSIIMGMKTKSCELDPLPTHVLKSILDTVLPS